MFALEMVFKTFHSHGTCVACSKTVTYLQEYAEKLEEGVDEWTADEYNDLVSNESDGGYVFKIYTVHHLE